MILTKYSQLRIRLVFYNGESKWGKKVGKKSGGRF